MAIDLSNNGDRFHFTRNLPSTPPLFSIAVWVKPAYNGGFGQTAFGAYCGGRDVDVVFLMLSGAGTPVLNWTGGDYNRNSGLSYGVDVWNLFVGTVNPGTVTTYAGNRSTGVFAKDLNTSGAPYSARSMNAFYCGVDPFDTSWRVPGLYAMVAMEKACWSESDVRRLFRGEPIEMVRPQAFVIMRNAQHRVADDNKTRLINDVPWLVRPNPSFLQLPPFVPQWDFISAGGGSTLTADLSSAGVGAAAWVGASTKAALLSTAGVGAASFVGAATDAAALSSAGIGAASWIGAATNAVVWGAAGIGAMSMVSDSSGSFAFAGSGVATWNGASTNAGVLTAAGSGDAQWQAGPDGAAQGTLWFAGFVRHNLNRMR